MSLASFSIKRPVVIASTVALMVIAGVIAIERLGMDLFPDVEVPYLVVRTTFPGASPEEVEDQITKPIEGEMSSIAGVKTINSYNIEGFSVAWVELDYDADTNYSEQLLNEKINRIRKDFPDGAEDPIVEKYNVDQDPVVRIALMAEIPDTKLYDLANEIIKPSLEQVNNVGTVTLVGGTRREIQVELDRDSLNRYKISASAVANRLKSGGVNVPLGKFEKGAKEMVFRSVGKHSAPSDILNSVIYFSGDADNAVKVSSLGTVRDGAEDKTMMAFYWQKDGSNGPVRPCIFLDVFKQSGANTVEVANAVGKKIDLINQKYATSAGSPRLSIVRDTSKFIRMNVDDVKLSIFLGIGLAVVIVYLFLGNVRSTIITGIAIPNSLLGGFILMYAMGFTVNVMTLLALSLTVGLLIDDAIVVRENIFRKLESGLPPDEASEKGTNEVMMAVIATTVTVIIVFLPVAFMTGIVGRFFKQFGLTIVFAMCVSLFDALAVAPLLSTYFSGKVHRTTNPVIKTFDRFQERVDRLYERVMQFALSRPWIVIAAAFVIFAGSLSTLAFVQRTFLPSSDDKEFKIQLSLPSGTSLQGTKDNADRVIDLVRSQPEVKSLSLQVGTSDGKSNKAYIHVELVPESKRKRNNTEVKVALRRSLAESFAEMKPLLAEYSVTSNPFPFILNIEGDNLDEMQVYAETVLASLKTMKELSDVDMLYDANAKEYQILLDKERMSRLGITPGIAGSELRSCVAGTKVGVFSEGGLDYDIRLRLRPDQRDIARGYNDIKIPNISGMMIPLTEISTLKEKNSPSVISRQNRKRIIQIAANIAPGEALGTAVSRVNRDLGAGLKPPAGIEAKIKGENDQMVELSSNIGFALKLSVALIFLVLASLYGSFITPVTILLALPPALSGAFLALAITGKTLDIYSMIGLVMLMGLVTKNSILLVDFAVKGVQAGMERKEAILRAGRLRLRPILMTTFAMLAGTLPVAVGAGEAAKPRMSMGIAIIGGILLSTVLTLVVVPAIFSYVDRLRERIEKPFALTTIRGKFGFGKGTESSLLPKKKAQKK